MPDIRESDHIRGVKIVQLTAYGDARGRFVETFRKEWFPEREWTSVQGNCSTSRAGVLRGLHYHHRQVDVWFVPQGTIRAGLADLRRSSPTRGKSEVIELGQESPIALFIPVGVAHGFATLSDAILMYVVDNYHDGTDENGVAWDDPTLAVPWGVLDPVLSPRDQANPRLSDIPEAELPD